MNTQLSAVAREAVTLTIPGIPVGFKRPRFNRATGAVFEESGYRNYKALAQDHMRHACAKPFLGPVYIHIAALWTCPTSEQRKHPVPVRWRPKRPDIDQIVKSLLDAGNGVLYLDDAQVVSLIATKLTAAQGEPGRVEIEIAEMDSLWKSN